MYEKCVCYALCLEWYADRMTFVVVYKRKMEEKTEAVGRTDSCWSNEHCDRATKGTGRAVCYNN